MQCVLDKNSNSLCTINYAKKEHYTHIILMLCIVKVIVVYKWSTVQ